MTAAAKPTPDVEALLFDVFGTVVDWRTIIIADLTAFGRAKGISADWVRFTDEWRALYQPSMEEVRAGRRPWTILDVLHRESLDVLVARHGITGLTDSDRDAMTRVWHSLQPWPDVVGGLTRLKTRFIIGTLSNGNVGLLTRLAKNAGLPWDVVLGAETARAYKPMPEAYQRSAEILNLPPSKVMLVAAHNGDLAAAAKAGLRTAYVNRPTEYGPHQKVDFKADGPWDIITDTFHGVADAFGIAV